MTFDLITACLATVAGIAMGVSPLLQAKRVIDVRDATTVSLGWLYVILVGDSVWMVRGLATGDKPIIIANVISLGAIAITIAVVHRFRAPRALVPLAPDVALPEIRVARHATAEAHARLQEEDTRRSGVSARAVARRQAQRLQHAGRPSRRPVR